MPGSRPAWGRVARTTYLIKAFFCCFPDDAESTTPAESVQAIQLLIASKLYSFSSRGAQGVAKAAQEMVNSLVHGFSPSLAQNPSSFMTQVWAR